MCCLKPRITEYTNWLAGAWQQVLGQRLPWGFLNVDFFISLGEKLFKMDKKGRNKSKFLKSLVGVSMCVIFLPVSDKGRYA